MDDTAIALLTIAAMIIVGLLAALVKLWTNQKSKENPGYNEVDRVLAREVAAALTSHMKQQNGVLSRILEVATKQYIVLNERLPKRSAKDD